MPGVGSSGAATSMIMQRNRAAQMAARTAVICSPRAHCIDEFNVGGGDSPTSVYSRRSRENHSEGGSQAADRSRGSSKHSSSRGARRQISNAEAPPTYRPPRRSRFGDNTDVQDTDGVCGNGMASRSSSMRSISTDLASSGVELCRHKLRKVFGSHKFDLVIGFVILANAINIGVEQSYRLNGWDTTTCDWLENFCLLVYTIELGCRLFAFGKTCFSDGWVIFDASLVAIGIIGAWIIEPIFAADADLVAYLGPLMVLRCCRLLRLARAVRLLVKFREMWILVRGLLSSGSTMFYTLLLLTIILYIFGCISMEVITGHAKARGDNPDPDFQEMVELYFNDLPSTLLTLSQFITLDNIVYIYSPLIKADPKLGIYFVSVLLVVSIVLMNLVTAVIVNSAMEQALQDKDVMKSLAEQQKKKLMKDLRGVFYRLDEDGSGEVSREEIGSICDDDKEILNSLMGGHADPLEIFDALDVDGSGDIGIEEFIDGLWQVSISKAPIEVKRMERQIERMRTQLWDTNTHVLQLLEATLQQNREAHLHRAYSEIKTGHFQVADAPQVQKASPRSGTPRLRLDIPKSSPASTPTHEVQDLAQKLLAEAEQVQHRMHTLLSKCMNVDYVKENGAALSVQPTPRTGSDIEIAIPDETPVSMVASAVVSRVASRDSSRSPTCGAAGVSRSQEEVVETEGAWCSLGEGPAERNDSRVDAGAGSGWGRPDCKQNGAGTNRSQGLVAPKFLASRPAPPQERESSTPASPSESGLVPLQVASARSAARPQDMSGNYHSGLLPETPAALAFWAGTPAPRHQPPAEASNPQDRGSYHSVGVASESSSGSAETTDCPMWHSHGQCSRVSGTSTGLPFESEADSRMEAV
eukprot:TRINITY_DN31430_c0_g1_i1.p1 TRINITY_DN31430_c0_g1~~TRINITY_DN31430_c0_g1_i1.p1  ORF type:complete len:868 (+),score=164.28 TRINITY_DN31430_c0_g1_i1:157-2760(+)